MYALCQVCELSLLVLYHRCHVLIPADVVSCRFNNLLSGGSGPAALQVQIVEERNKRKEQKTQEGVKEKNKKEVQKRSDVENKKRSEESWATHPLQTNKRRFCPY